MERLGSLYAHTHPRVERTGQRGHAGVSLELQGKPQLSSVCSEPKHLIVNHSLSKVGCVQPFVLDSLFVYPRLALPSHSSPEFWSC